MSWFTSNIPTNNTGFTGLGGTPVTLDQQAPTFNTGQTGVAGQPVGFDPVNFGGGGMGYLGGSPNFNEAGQYDGGSEGPGGITGKLERYDPNSPFYQPNLGPMIVPAGGSTSTGGTSYAVTGNQNDPAYIGQWLKGQGVQDKDIAYYTQKIQGVGGLGDGKWWSEQIHSTAPGAGGGAGMGAANSPLLAPYGQTFQGGGPVPQFNAPSGLDLANDPGYQARMKMGADAIQNSAAAKGKLLTGGTLKDLTQYGQDFGSNEYSNVFNRALSAYGANLTGQNQGFNQAYNTFGANYDIFRNNQTDPFNKLYSLTGLGLNATGAANGAGNAYAGNLGNNSTSYTGIGQNSANNVGSTQIGQGNVNAASQIQQGNNTGAYIQQAGSLATDPAIMGWFQKHWFGQPSGGSAPTTDAGNY